MTETPVQYAAPTPSAWADDPIVMVPVPLRFYPAVLQTLARSAPAAPAAHRRGHPAGNGWTPTAIARLIQYPHVNTSARALLTLIALNDGRAVYFSDLAAKVDVPMANIRGQLGGFSKVLARPEFAGLGPLFKAHTVHTASGASDTEYTSTLGPDLWALIRDSIAA